MLKSKYITADDFKLYYGMDLEAQYKDDDNSSNKVNAFLYRIETRLSAFLDANFHRNVEREFPEFTDYQKEHYKLALLEQAMYVLRNSDISTDSGYDPERGILADRNKLKTLAIAPNCKDHLMLCGLWCRKIKYGSRMGFFDDWLY